MFDIDALVNVPAAGPMATTIPLCPEGEYTALIDSLPSEGMGSWFRPIEGKDGKPDRLILRVPFVIMDDTVKATLERDKVVVPKDIWLDFGPDNRTLLTTDGKNVDLGRLREALGQNTMPNWTFGALPGAGPLKVLVKHRVNRNDPEQKFAEVTRVSAL